MKFKKYRIADEDGNNYEVEEEIVNDNVKEEIVNDDDVEEDVITEIAEPLTDKEIEILRELIMLAPKLKELVQIKNENASGITEDDEETVIETEKTKDSKASFGSLKKKITNIDSIDNELEIEEAWKKRYGGNR